MTGTRERKQALNDFWNAVVAGAPEPTSAGLDRADRAAVLFLHRAATEHEEPTVAEAWQKVLTRIADGPADALPMPQAQPSRRHPDDPLHIVDVPPGTTPLSQRIGRGGQGGEGAHRVWTPRLNLLATAALLLLALTVGLFAFGPLRPEPDERAPDAPSLIGITSPEQGLVGEVPLDVAVGPLPAGPVQLLAGEVRLQPGVTMSEPPISGLVILNVEQGTIAVLIPDQDAPLRAGDQITVPVVGGFAVRNDGDDEAVFLQAFVLDATATGGREYNTAAHYSTPGGGAGYWPIAVGADLPAGPGWITLERLTLQPGAELPPFVATGLDWVAPFAGRVGITLEGDHLPFRWDSGEERTFAAHDKGFPRFTPGTRVTLRNAGDEELVLLRLAFASLANTPSP